MNRSVASTARIWNFKEAAFNLLGDENRVYFQEDLEPVPTVHKHKFQPVSQPTPGSSLSACLRYLGRASILVLIRLDESLINDDNMITFFRLPQDMTPMQRSSRKGFLRTRWQLAENLAPFELINVHLFHDESNFVAMQQVSLTLSLPLAGGQSAST